MFLMEDYKYEYDSKNSEIRKAEALIKALGSIGILRYMEEYDNGGTGDYTAEKHEQLSLSLDEILDMKRPQAQ